MYFMTIFYVAAGVALLTVVKFESLSETNKNVVGFILIGYGIFRMYARED